MKSVLCIELFPFAGCQNHTFFLVDEVANPPFQTEGGVMYVLIGLCINSNGSQLPYVKPICAASILSDANLDAQNPENPLSFHYNTWKIQFNYCFAGCQKLQFFVMGG
jgi:hypothetical protein